MSEPIESVVERLRHEPRLVAECVHSIYLPGDEAIYADPRPALPEGIRAGLDRRGVDLLWSHQVEGLQAVREGKNVLVTTPTASGKSLVFYLPTLELASFGEVGNSLFLFPLKALGQDQKQKFDAFAKDSGLGSIARCEVYDGDTPRDLRRKIKRQFPRVIITNPDMLHLGILGHWQSWSPFLRGLRWIVIDELHACRGIFGSHFHHVLQRLLRICRSEGASPRLIASSATAGNAPEFAERLAGVPFEWVQHSGAPREGRHLLLYRPTASPYTTALRLLVELLQSGLKTIVFTKARRITELLYSWLRQQAPELAERVACYRSGFLPAERRKIEARLFEGSLDGVISTSALEMGIDVGGLDACVLVGYPGSVMATWQRSGRVGRAGRDSITALVALPDALDQYFVDHPDEFVGRPCEKLIVDPANESVARAHLVCAAAEMPLDRKTDEALLVAHAPLIGDLLRTEELRESGGRLLATERQPHRKVSLRGSGSEIAIVDGARKAIIGTIDGNRVQRECHPGAIYLHGGELFTVAEYDPAGGKVIVERAEVDYFTTPMTEKETEILEVLRVRHDGALQAWLGRLLVTERVVGFERKKIRGQEPIDRIPLEMPAQTFETVGLWWAAPEPVEQALSERHYMGALHASEHAAISLFPLVALCDRGDIGGISIPLHPQVGCGAVFIYDGHPGGVGIAQRGFEELPELLRRVQTLLESCSCEAGCPSCVQSPKCGNGNRPLDKVGARELLTMLLDEPSLSVPPIEIQPRVVREESPAAVSRSSTASIPISTPAPETAAPVSAPRKAARGRERGPSPIADRTTVLFDLETVRGADEVGGWNRAYRMRVALGVTYRLEEGVYSVFQEDAVPELIAELEAADLVIGFNSRRFDYEVLSGYTGIDYARRLPTLDLLDSVETALGHRIGMGALAEVNLGVGKSADGRKSLEWVAAGDLARVEEYCRRDVEILRDLYLLGRRMGGLEYRDSDGEKKSFDVDW